MAQRISRYRDEELEEKLEKDFMTRLLKKGAVSDASCSEQQLAAHSSVADFTEKKSEVLSIPSTSQMSRMQGSIFSCSNDNLISESEEDAERRFEVSFRTGLLG